MANRYPLVLNGTSIQELQSADALSLTSAVLSGTVTLNAGTANQVQFLNASKVLSGSANLTFDGTTLTAAGFSGPISGNASSATKLATARTIWGQSFDGTANISGAITGATDITASGNLTLSSGTANGVLYLNGSKAVTSGSALTFDGATFSLAPASGSSYLKASRATQSSGEVGIELFGGTGGGTSWYIFQPVSTNSLAFYGNGSEQMRLTSTGLGIGTSSPGAKLDVNGAAKFGSSVYLNGTVLGLSGVMEGYSTVYGTIAAWRTVPSDGINPFFAIDTSANGITLRSDGSSYRSLMFATGGSARMTLDASGNLGIGALAGAFNQVVNAPHMVVGTGTNTAPGLTLFGSAASAPIIAFANGTSGNQQYRGFIQYDHSAGAMVFATAATERARIDSSGNLGIGTSSPQAWTSSTYSAISKLTVAGTGEQNIAVRSDDTNATRAKLFVSSSGGPWGLWTDGSKLKPFVIGGYTTEWMRLDASGNLGVGTSSPGVKLEVVGETYIRGATNKASLSLLGASAATDGAFSISSQATRSLVVRDEYFGAERLRIDASGNLGLGVTPSGWNSVLKFLEFPEGVGFGGYTGGPNLYAVTNAYYSNAASWVYKTTAAASNYEQGSGQHRWYTAPSGTAGSAITFTQAMTLDASGNLGIGTSNPQTKVFVSSNNATNNNSVPLISLASDRTDRYSSINCVREGNSESIGIAFSTSAVGVAPTERARIDSSGNFGIGTSSPGAKLDVNGSIYIRGTNILGLYNADNTNSFQIYNSGATGVGNGNLVFTSSAVGVRMTLDASGNLGLGVTPSAWSGFSVLEMPGGFYGSNSGTGIWSGQNTYYNGTNWIYKTTAAATYTAQAGGAHAWFTAPSGTAGNAISFTQAMTLDASGNLGLGTTAPGGGANDRQFTAYGSNTAQVSASAGAILATLGSNGSVGYVGVSGANPLTFATNNSERARIDSSGNLLVGTTSVGTSDSNSFTVNVAAPAAISVNHSGTSAGSYYVGYGYNGSLIGSITQNGTTGVSYNTSSDYRLKNITGPITTSGQYIDSLKPVEGTWKADGSTFVGLIAHEAQEVSRTQVATGVKDGEEMQGMDYSAAEIIANLIAEVQSLRKRLAAAGIA